MALVLYFTDLLLLAARRSDLLGATLSLRPPSASLTECNGAPVPWALASVGMGLCKKWMMGRWLTMAALPRIRVIQRHPSLHRSACTEGGSAK
ncbi:hypothetical protein Zm00014a_027311 [Zea mays]|uniref:Secreted protein n=1 Tax=Zea mays TaxID=4577 RepID=A0A317YIT3_MAIZE|nr:hypothetical protein Zm00014a_027311 [Zea mays]